MAKMFIDEVHAQNVLQRMWEQTECKEYCDVALIAGYAEEMQISAHRSVLSASSEYFKTMFTPPFNESTAKEVKLPDVDGESLKSLVKFCYSGRLEMTEDTVEKLLITADSLLLEVVVNACGNFLAEQLHPTNCLGIAQLAERHCDTLIKKAKDFCMKNFVELYKTEEFLNLSVEQLTQLLSSDDLYDPTEEHVFKSLMVWLEHDLTGREQYKDEMLKLVRLPLLKPAFLFHQVQPVCDSVASRKLYTEATDWHLVADRRVVNISEFAKPRRSHERLMAVRVTNNKLEVLYHCQERLKWMKRLENLDCRRQDFGVALMGDDLFVVGGSSGVASLNTVISLNLKTMNMKNENPMGERRWGLGVAVINDSLYVMGGYNGKYLSSLEKWDSKSNRWDKLASMSIKRFAFGIAVFNEKIYVVGGLTDLGDEEMVDEALSSAEYYNPQNNVWTSIASMCERRFWPGMAVVNGMLYAVSGGESQTIERYDHETNKWTIIYSFCKGISGSIFTTFNDKIIILRKDRVEEYDFTTNEFRVNPAISGLENVDHTFSFSGSLIESKFIEC